MALFNTIREDLRVGRNFNHKGASTLGWVVGVLGHRSTHAVIWYRFGRWAKSLRIPGVSHFFKALYLIGKPFNEAWTGIMVASDADIGPGFVIHSGNGVFIGNIRMGRNVVVQHGVVIAYGTGGVGDNVYFGAGAKVVGKAKIGSDVLIGANAVVAKDIPDRCTAVGIPAKVVRQNDED